MPIWKYSLLETMSPANEPVFFSPGTEAVFGVLAGQPNVTTTATSMRYSGANSSVGLYQGTGIVTDLSDNVSGGTINKLTVKAEGVVLLTATDLNISAERVFDAMTGDSYQLAELAFSGRDTVFGTTRSDSLYGFAKGDTLFGRGGLDALRGGIGDDRLYGGNGDDSLESGNGKDLLSGGNGNDLLDGEGAGADRFVFNSTLGSANADTVAGFSSASDDLILLDNDIFVALGAAGNLAGAHFRAGTAATDASDRIIYDSATGKLFYDRDGTGSAGQKLIATFEIGGPAPTLHASDFLIIN